MGNEMLNIAVSDVGGTRMLKLTGDLDSFTSERLMNASKTWVPDRGKLLINLDELEYIDSSGLSVLVLISVEAKNKGIPMTISCRNSRVHRVLEITGLHEFFHIEGVLPDTGFGIDSKCNISGVGLPDDTVYQPVKPSQTRTMHR